MTAEGPMLVDWVSAMRGPAVLELGFLRVILSELGPEVADNPERPRSTNAAAQSEYARLAGMSLAELTAAVEPYLPIARTFVVLGNVFSGRAHGGEEFLDLAPEMIALSQQRSRQPVHMCGCGAGIGSAAVD